MFSKIKKWEPIDELVRLEDEFNELFRRSFGALAPGFMTELWRPDVNCFMEGGNYVVDVDLPGIDEKDLDISVTGRHLTIKGERKTGWDEEKEGHIRHESFYGCFERTLLLPDGVDTDKVHANIKNGVLRVSMPVNEHVLPKKITVHAEKGLKGEKKAA